jgi:hypothetical protein
MLSHAGTFMLCDLPFLLVYQPITILLCKLRDVERRTGSDKFRAACD